MTTASSSAAPAAVPALVGFTVGVTAARRAEELATMLERRGAVVLHGPAIRIVPLADDADLLAASLDNRNEQTEAMLAERLKAFEQVFELKGTALSEKIERDSSALGTLITRHVTEFDQNIKTYGGALIDEYLAQPTTQSSAWGTQAGLYGGGGRKTTPACAD